MNLGNKRIKKRFNLKYKITKAGWVVILLSSLVIFLEQKFYVGSFLDVIKDIDKGKVYDKECEALVELECTIVDIYRKYSPINDFKEPVFVYTYRDNKTGKEFEFEFIEEKDPGKKKGDSSWIKVKKEVFIKEDVGRPMCSGLNVLAIVATPIVGFLLIVLIMGCIGEVWPDTGLVLEFSKDRDEYRDCKKAENFIITIFCALPAIIMIISSLAVLIYSLG